ncbi:XRE family transcriptional regulator [Crossiella cryophila]|uniref:Transcriptional regulator with XRE-family HTH domain n=1 Tax=Crossiella cryophila TaxID=43355 RepID=A0A7W7C5E5_9PSEU|nr:XRE family transcriptional regulator [Crossiella cryophila]MBB4674834.1 transcriptional regulator with XRE-family HTH domain [Crossiella cryophila]
MGTGEHDGEGPPPFAEALNLLFDKRRRADGRMFSNEDIAAAIRANGGAITQSYIWMLRNGQRDDPKASHLRALATAFDVPAGYFLDAPVHERVRAELDGRVAQAGASDALLDRVRELSPLHQHLIMVMIEQVGELEKRETDR